ncbi:DUF4349 domain-containing protein [Halobacteriaceae archaeon GCM10025711]
MAGRNRRLVLAVALAAMVVLAGCSGGGTGDSAPGGEATSAPTEAADGSGGAATDADRRGSVQANLDARLRIRTGSMTLEVSRFDEARRTLTTATRDLGGYVGGSSAQRHQRDNQSWQTGRLVLRVPAENFSTLVDRAAAAGVVLDSQTEVEDVTEQVVDLEARLSNLRAQRDRLRSLYDDANETEDVLHVQERLSEVQSEIERLEARLRTLEGRVAYSTLTLTLREPSPGTTVGRTEAAWYDIPLLAAFLQSVSGVWTLLRAVAVGVAYLAPYALVFGLPATGGYLLWRRRA